MAEQQKRQQLEDECAALSADRAYSLELHGDTRKVLASTQAALADTQDALARSQKELKLGTERTVISQGLLLLKTIRKWRHSVLWRGFSSWQIASLWPGRQGRCQSPEEFDKLRVQYAEELAAQSGQWGNEKLKMQRHILATSTKKILQRWIQMQLYKGFYKWKLVFKKRRSKKQRINTSISADKPKRRHGTRVERYTTKRLLASVVLNWCKRALERSWLKWVIRTKCGFIRDLLANANAVAIEQRSTR